MFTQLFLITLFLGTTFFSVKTFIQKKEISVVRLVIAFIILGIHLSLANSNFEKSILSTTPFSQMALFGSILIFASIIKQMYYDFRNKSEPTENLSVSDDFDNHSSYRHLDKLKTLEKNNHLSISGRKETSELQER